MTLTPYKEAVVKHLEIKVDVDTRLSLLTINTYCTCVHLIPAASSYLTKYLKPQGKANPFTATTQSKQSLTFC